VILYPILAVAMIAGAQAAWTMARIADEPDKAAKHWLRLRNALYLFAVIVLVSAFGAHYVYAIPTWW